MYVFQALIVFVLDLPVTGCCVLSLQSQISILEQTHSQRLLEVTACHRQELDLQTERMRDSQQQAERALEAREKAHRQRVHCLEEQVWESYKNCMYCNSDIYITFNSKKPLMKWKWKKTWQFCISQVCTLKEQLEQEMKRRQAYMKQMLRLGL